jgi:hypothetical protein
MDSNKRHELVRMGWDIHAVVEESYRQHPASKNDPEDWREKRRLLLADMAIHLLQTALEPGDVELDKLRNNLHAILTISDGFLPDAGFRTATGKLYGDRGRGLL